MEGHPLPGKHPTSLSAKFMEFYHSYVRKPTVTSITDDPVPFTWCLGNGRRNTCFPVPEAYYIVYIYCHTIHKSKACITHISMCGILCISGNYDAVIELSSLCTTPFLESAFQPSNHNMTTPWALDKTALATTSNYFLIL